jgi:hypothetical protein
MTVPAHLTSTATDLWDHLDTARTDEQILVALRDRYAGDAGEIARDLAQAMGELEALGLVRRES